jgi:hypothetical protein
MSKQKEVNKETTKIVSIEIRVPIETKYVTIDQDGDISAFPEMPKTKKGIFTKEIYWSGDYYMWSIGKLYLGCLPGNPKECLYEV